ncbi:MAG: NAD(+)/NADH kinase [Clostridia bacterium]
MKKRALRKKSKTISNKKAEPVFAITAAGIKSGWSRSIQSRYRRGVECILVLGGDGTLIRAARDLYHWNIPMLGVNLGTLGYLCEVERSNIRAAIDEIMQEHYMIERRMMLEGYCVIDGKEQKSRAAFNDIIIHRGTNPSVKTLIIRVSGEVSQYICRRQDRCSDTGNLPDRQRRTTCPRGGPIVDPRQNCF